MPSTYDNESHDKSDTSLAHATLITVRTAPDVVIPPNLISWLRHLSRYNSNIRKIQQCYQKINFSNS